MAIADQVPVGSDFGARGTGSEVLADIGLTGKTAIVTGGYSGIGLETVRCLTEKERRSLCRCVGRKRLAKAWRHSEMPFKRRRWTWPILRRSSALQPRWSNSSKALIC